MRIDDESQPGFASANERAQQTLALSFSLLITLGLLTALFPRSAIVTAPISGNPMQQLLLLPSPVAAAKIERTPPPPAPVIRAGRQRQVIAIETADTPSAPVQATHNTASMAAEPLSEAAAASPGKLLTDSQAIRRAYQDSKTEIQKMADASGKHLADPGLSKSEQIQQQLAYARVPGCTDSDALKFVPPKVAGISLTGLLAVPFVAKAALTGKCKIN